MLRIAIYRMRQLREDSRGWTIPTLKERLREALLTVLFYYLEHHSYRFGDADIVKKATVEFSGKQITYAYTPSSQLAQCSN